MTHFTVGIVVPKEEMENAKSYIENTMGQYAEEPEGQYLEFEIAHKKEDFEKDAKRIIEEVKTDAKLKEKYETLLKERRYQDIFGTWEGGEENKDGDWGHKTNPNSFYDWYAIGGRWNGALAENETEKDDEGIKPNSLPAKELKKKWLKKTRELEIKQLNGKMTDNDWNNFEFATMIDINGDVHKSENVGWFGMSKPTKDAKDWHKIYSKILAEAAKEEAFVVALDCHV